MVSTCQASYYVQSTFHMQSSCSILQTPLKIAENLVGLHHAQLGSVLADPLKFQACLATIGFADYSLCIKAGVHFTLCGGTIAKLGTEKHHTKLLPLLDDLTLPGCFGMTELGHGSNVMGIQTQVLCAACMCVS
jgi:acyl-CoA oxidase